MYVYAVVSEVPASMTMGEGFEQVVGFFIFENDAESFAEMENDKEAASALEFRHATVNYKVVPVLMHPGFQEMAESLYKAPK